MKIISLEIGSSAVKAGLASYDEHIPGSALTLESVATEKLSNSVRYGRILNVEDVTSATARVLAALSEHPEIADGKIAGVYVGVGGRSLASMRDSEDLRIPDERYITRELIERLTDDALSKVPAGKEPLQIIDLGYKVNGVAVDRPEGSYGTDLSADFTIIYADPLNTRNIERVVKERLGRHVFGYMVRPVAIADAVLTEDERKAGCMLVDMGAETTTCSVYAHGELQYVATFPMGGRNITRDLAMELGITEEKAEFVKLEKGKAMNDSSMATYDEVMIDNIVQARASEIVANIVAQIGFAGFSEADMRAGIVVTGGGARLHNMCKLLGALSGLKVRMATVPQSIHIADPNIDINDNIDVISLALAARRQNELAEKPDHCVEFPQPAPKPEPEPEPEPERGNARPADEGFTISDVPEDDEEEFPADRAEDEHLMEDDEETEARRAAERRRKAEESIAAARKELKEKKNQETKRKFGHFMSNLGKFLGGGDGDGDGQDLS